MQKQKAPKIAIDFIRSLPRSQRLAWAKYLEIEFESICDSCEPLGNDFDSISGPWDLSDDEIWAQIVDRAREDWRLGVRFC